jgi:diguanylate cyclase (GGDEF)-like protein/PAS domain S-box-containing protein
MGNERILIVEDERIIAIDLQRRLEKFGYRVTGIVSTGDAAIDHAEAESPDIILMDIMLSGEVDGIEAASRIKDTLHIPVIFLTAYSDERTLERAKAAEPFGYILKPFKEKELYTTIDIALYKHSIDNQLRKQERWATAVLDSIQDGIITTDVDNGINFMNPMAESISGWKESDATAIPIDEVLKIHNDSGELFFDFSTPAADTEHESPVSFENSILENKAGNYINVEGAISHIRDRDGQIEGRVITFRDTTEMRRLSDTISYQASHDTLTGIANRDSFSKSLTALYNESQLEGNTHGLIYIDLDQFKVINDTCGHAAGDDLLVKTTGIIQNVVRNSDICARLGSDEFGILLENSTKDQTKFIAERLHNRFASEKLVWDNNVFNISCSIGVVMITADSGGVNLILAAADDACFLAKEQGGNRIKIYETSGNVFLRRRGEMAWISRITKALEEDRFCLYYQIIAPLQRSDGGRNKYEILVRMIDTDGSLIMPADFIPAAERYTLMPRLDRWIISAALKHHARIYGNSGGDGEVFSLNVSAASLNDESFLSFITNLLKETEVSPHSVCIELTETTAISNMAIASRFINNLKAIGCTFALDDFGSGFSSFSYLKNLPVDFLKIDGSFVKDIDEDHVNRSMVEAMNTLAHTMGKQTIAEFVTNSEIMGLLSSMGVDFGQGYEIAKPRPLAEL